VSAYFPPPPIYCLYQIKPDGDKGDQMQQTCLMNSSLAANLICAKANKNTMPYNYVAISVI